MGFYQSIYEFNPAKHVVVFKNSADGLCYSQNMADMNSFKVACPTDLKEISELPSGTYNDVITHAGPQLKAGESLARLELSWPTGENKARWLLTTSTGRTFVLPVGSSGSWTPTH